jgi:hypothetical protein
MSRQRIILVAERFSDGVSASLLFRIVLLFLLLTTSGFLSANANAQGQVQPPRAADQVGKKQFSLRVSKGDITGVSLKANEARLTEIALELSRRLDARVILGPGLAKQTLTLEFADLTLPPAMRLLAPRVYMDYEIRENAQPKLLAVYLLSEDDPTPAANAVVQGSSDAILIEGNTEDDPEESEVDRANDPLQVELEENRITIKSKKQLLAAVVLTVAEVLGVPAEIRYDSTEIVDTTINNASFEEAITGLSPNIRLYVREDVNRSLRTPLRIAIVPPVVKDSGQ